MSKGETKNKTSDLIKIRCLGACDREKTASVNNFYANINPLFTSERLSVCKDCIISFLGDKDSKDYITRVYLVLALLNKPFILNKWEECNGEWANYIRQISSLPHHKGQSFGTSDFGIQKANYKNTEDQFGECVDDEESYEHEFTADLIKYWGHGYEDNDYHYLEDEKIKLMSSFECPDYGMEMIMRDICFINLDIENKRRDKDKKASSSKEIGNLIETRSKLMNDANIKPIQSTGSEGNDQMSFGVLIKKWENEKPVPKALDDEMKTYIDTYMVGHLAKMEGLNNEMTEKYDKALSEYTIDFKEIKRINDFEEE